MPIKLPEGFLTRPEAAKLYNRSQRALERELDPALAMHDEEILIHWKLLTKDGKVQEASEVTTEIVKQLVADGMTPTWCVEGSWLEEKYGRKGEPRPQTKVEPPASNRSPTSQNRTDPAPAGQTSERGEASHYLQRENEFLKERIRSLEHEKQEELKRNEKREAKLFEQLEVKDRQISAWDELTQGITKALATGQIAPSLTAGRQHGKPSNEEEGTGVIEVKSDVVSKQQEQEKAQRSQPTAPQKSKVASKRKQKKPAKAAPKKAEPPAEADFFSTALPTFSKLFGRKRKR
jgi:hypothetical protein